MLSATSCYRTTRRPLSTLPLAQDPIRSVDTLTNRFVMSSEVVWIKIYFCWTQIFLVTLTFHFGPYRTLSSGKTVNSSGSWHWLWLTPPRTEFSFLWWRPLIWTETSSVAFNVLLVLPSVSCWFFIFKFEQYFHGVRVPTHTRRVHYNVF